MGGFVLRTTRAEQAVQPLKKGDNRGNTGDSGHGLSLWTDLRT